MISQRRSESDEVDRFERITCDARTDTAHHERITYEIHHPLRTRGANIPRRYESDCEEDGQFNRRPGGRIHYMRKIYYIDETLRPPRDQQLSFIGYSTRRMRARMQGSTQARMQRDTSPLYGVQTNTKQTPSIIHSCVLPTSQIA